MKPGMGDAERRRPDPPASVEKKVQINFTGTPFLARPAAERSLDPF
jgi:hypothetical protein